MTEQSQSYANHPRFFALYHFFALPVLAFYAIYELVQLVRHPSVAAGGDALVALAIAALALAARAMPLTVQDRLIRLEETMRMQRVLPAAQQGDIARLQRKDFVALRFASDAELPELVRRTVAGELTSQKAIKQAIKDWRPDYFRA